MPEASDSESSGAKVRSCSTRGVIVDQGRVVHIRQLTELSSGFGKRLDKKSTTRIQSLEKFGHPTAFHSYSSQSPTTKKAGSKT